MHSPFSKALTKKIPGGKPDKSARDAFRSLAIKVPRISKIRNSTRAIEAMRKAWRQGTLEGAVVAIGNAPTALLEVARLVREEGAQPALVIGVPVGFVSAAESKEAALALPTPHIVARGRKGGSPIAVAIIHALLLLSSEAGT